MRNGSQFVFGLAVIAAGAAVMIVAGAVAPGVIVVALGVLLLIRWSSVSYRWACETCGREFSLTMWQDLCGINGGILRKYVRCPACGHRRWCRGI